MYVHTYSFTKELEKLAILERLKDMISFVNKFITKISLQFYFF